MIDLKETGCTEDMLETSKDTRLACDTCGNRYRYRRGLIEHIRLRHPNLIRCKADHEFNRNFECLVCGKKYSYKRGLLAHMKYRHPESTVKKHKNFVCELCCRRYSYARGLREHIKKQHIIAVVPEELTKFKDCKIRREECVGFQSFSECNMKRIDSTTMNLDETGDRFICSSCNKVYTSRRGLVDHIVKRHPDTTETENHENKSFKCRTCFKMYHFRSSLSTHVRKNHPEKLTVCMACNRTFLFRAKLIRHLQKKHVIAPEEQSFKRGVRKQPIRVCPICMTTYSKKAQIVDHLASAHDIQLKCEWLEFDHLDAFSEWKRATELSTCSRYVLYNRYRSDTEYVTHFVCHRSGLFCTKSKGIRNIRRVGSKKINSFCPAEIRVRVNARTRQHVVDFCSTHIGHDNGHLRELRYFKASKDERDKILNDLSANSSLTVVTTPKALDLNQVSQFVVCELGDVGCTASSSFDSGDAMGVGPQCHELALMAELVADDLTDADIDWWIDENADFVFYYKRKHVADPHHPELEDADLVLVIMEECQSGMLKSFGSNIVAVDRARAHPDDDYVVFTLSVIDELYLEFVCVYMFSSRDDELVYRLLFEKLRQRVGALQTRVFISDSSEACGNAWNAVMPAAGRWLYCDQRVHQDWLRRLDSVASLRKRHETRLFLTSLKNELNVYRFHERLDAWSNGRDPDLRAFRRYFDDAYAKRASRWAYCYRKHAGVTVSAAASRFVAKGRQKLAADERTLALARALNLLSETMHDFYAEKLKIEADAKLVPKMRNLRRLHCVAVKNVDSTRLINQLTDTQWYVPSLSAEEEDENLVHRVEMVKPVCGCGLRCELCDACLHTFVCTCVTSCIEFEMCEHIHLVCLFRQQNPLVEKLESVAAVSAGVENVLVKVELSKTACADEGRPRLALVDLINDPLVQNYG